MLEGNVGRNFRWRDVTKSVLVSMVEEEGGKEEGSK